MTLEIITSETLTPVKHGFFTRRGGASSGIFEGLNCGYGSSDQREAVSLNRSRVADAMDVPPGQLATIHQVHSADVAVIDDGATAAEIRADAMVTATPGIALGILTADCQPVLFADPDVGVVGAAHAGWKGTMSGILGATIDAMEDLGAHRAKIQASIGPTISRENYEVGPEFHAAFIDDEPETARFFRPGHADRHYFDLPAYGLAKLAEAGIRDPHWTGHCTYADPERFFSYRRSVHAKEADYGRLIAAIRL